MSTSTPNLAEYLERIGYIGPIEPTLDVLRAVHRSHALSIAYENLDVLLERPVSMEIEPTFVKIVLGGRGGWCYEMNGLLGWALTEMGFAVTRMTGGVNREFFGDEAFGNHVVLRVDLDEPWLADVGIGDCFLEPIPLRAGFHKQARAGARYELINLGGEEWRLRNREGARPPSFDFINGEADERLLARVSQSLQQDPESMFRTRLICQQMTPAGGSAVIDHTCIDMATGNHEPLDCPDALLEVIRSTVGAVPPDAQALWERSRPAPR